MRAEITQRQLKNESGEVMRRLGAGESFIVTRNGVAVGRLTPLHKHAFVPKAAALAAFANAPPVDFERLRADLDAPGKQRPASRY